MSEDRPPARIKSDNGHLRLGPGAEVGVVGGGPAGSFFSLFLLQMAWRAGLNLRVTIYEPRDFTGAGAKSCNMCGGIISESLLQNLAAEGLRLPRAVVQKRIDSYFLHMDVGNVRIETPLGELLPKPLCRCFGTNMSARRPRCSCPTRKSRSPRGSRR